MNKIEHKRIEENLPLYWEINDRIKKLQDKIINEAKNIDKELIRRVEDGNDFLDDYEIDIKVFFILRKDDIDYIEDEDNILKTISELVTGISLGDESFRWKRNYNHNTFSSFSRHPMRHDYHCWWFKRLYEYNDLTLDDLIRIGSIWTEIKVYYQYNDR